MSGDRVTLYAYKESLQDILKAFSRAGVYVRADPSIQRAVSIAVRDEDLEAVLAELLDPLGYAFFWQRLDGPLGPIDKLAEIQVFLPGQQESMVDFSVPDEETFTVRRGADGKGPPYVADEILLGVKAGTSLSEFQALVGQLGGTVVDVNKSLGIYRIRFSPGTNIESILQRLDQNDMVVTAEPNYVIQLPTGTGSSTDVLTSGKTGKSSPPPEGAPRVAVLDSGVLALDSLEGVLAGSYNALNPNHPVSDPAGHGTQMALIASGAVLPQGAENADAETVPVLAIQGFNKEGQTSSFGIARSIEYAIEQGAKVLNLSWGTPYDSEFMKNAVLYAQAKGLVVVASAGNEPINQPMYPAAYPGVLAVSAAKPDGSIWEQSNYGDFVSLAAPASAEFDIGYQGPPGGYTGTSISSAFVANTLARYFHRYPQASVGRALEKLQASLEDAGAEGRDPMYGSGLLSEEAVQRFLSTAP